MITNYNEYNQMNEKLDLFGSLKNLFGKLMQNINDEMKKPVEELTNKLKKEKNPKKVKKLLNEYLTKNKDSLNKALVGTKNANELPNIVEDNLVAIYCSIDACIKVLGSNKYNFNDIFKKESEDLKKLFSKNEKQFNKRVGDFSYNLVLSLGKPFKISKEDLVLNENILFEAELSDGEQKEQIDNAEQGNDDKVQEIDNNASERSDNLNNLIESIEKWFDMTLYKNIVNNVVKTDNKTDNVDVYSSIPDEITKNKGNVKEMINKYISSIKDKKELLKLRDYLSKNGYDVDSFKF